jgi:hypothetical protein
VEVCVLELLEELDEDSSLEDSSLELDEVSPPVVEVAKVKVIL